MARASIVTAVSASLLVALSAGTATQAAPRGKQM
jgi:hypothetical protein